MRVDNHNHKPINVSLAATIWRALSITSAKLGIHKREAVTRAILEFISKHDPETAKDLLKKD